MAAENAKYIIRKMLGVFKKALQHPMISGKVVLRRVGLRRPLWPQRNKSRGHFCVLLAGGFGYRNTGDEAQLAACLQRWRKGQPAAELVVLSPDPDYTSTAHNVRSYPASRIVFFQSNLRPDYGQSSQIFQSDYFAIKRRMLFAAWCFKMGLPVVTASRDELGFIQLLESASVLHLTGGGYLTGMTRSRLWDHMMLLRLAHVLKVPSILTGQTIGIFKSGHDRRLARWGLRTVTQITLRDRNESRLALADIGVTGDHIKERFDDALFCDQSDPGTVHRYLAEAGINNDIQYVAVNIHQWGQGKQLGDRLNKRMAELCDYLIETHKLQVLFCPMVKTDEESIRACISSMRHRGAMLAYNYDYRVVRGVIGGAALCFTMKHHPIVFAMGNAIPAIAVSVDEYYRHKNSGALALFGMEDNLLHGDVLFGSQALDTINRVCRERANLRSQIQLRLSAYSEQDGNVMRRILMRTYSIDGRVTAEA